MEKQPILLSEVREQSIKTNLSSVGSTVDLTSEMFKKIILSVCPEFVVDTPELKELMNDIYHYCNGRPSNLDPRKGILLWGDIGTGKSTIIKIVGELLRVNGQGYMTVNCSHLATQFAANGLEALNSSTYNNADIRPKPVNRAFDELGREPMPARHYGTELNVMQYVFQCRYELRDKVRTFVTTNLHPKAIGKLYGEYISDRVGEMFNVREIKGKSRR